MKNLLIITNSFPFGLPESSFLRPEIRELKKQFHITVIARNTTEEQTTELPDDVSVYRYDSRKDYNALTLFTKTVFTADFYSELFSLIKTKRFTFKKLNKLIHYGMRSEHFAKYAEKIRSKIQGDAVLYTYWNDYSVRSLSLIKRKGDKIVSRLHRADLYLSRNSEYYFPLKELSNKKTDLLAFISDNGKKYFEDNFAVNATKAVCRLGVKSCGSRSPFNPENKISILSLSYLSPVKRVEKIIETLSVIDDINIDWVHIGDGTERERITSLAYEKLNAKENISYSFAGAMENKAVLRFIAEHQFDLLLNVSSSEGIPVSMMESMSLGLPVIATDVGGVGEIVENGKNGFLLDKDFTENESAELIRKYFALSDSEKYDLRDGAFNTWASKYDAQKNFTQFADLLAKI